MKRDKLIFLSCVTVFILCIILFIFTYKEERGQENNQNQEQVNSVEQNVKVESDKYHVKDEEFQESKYRYDSTRFIYKKSAVDIEKLLKKNEQLTYFQFTIYDYLFSRGYDEIELIEVGEAVEEADNIKFSAQIHNEDEILKLNIEYDTEMLSFFYYFEEAKLEAKPVKLSGVDEILSEYIEENQSQIEKELGKYIFKEKLEANEAKIKWYQEENGKLVIQLELQDEYLTYCKLYFDLETNEIEFKKWG